MSSEEILNDRKNKFLRIGRNKGFITNVEDLSSLTSSDNNLSRIFQLKKFFIPIVAIGLITLLALVALL